MAEATASLEYSSDQENNDDTDTDTMDSTSDESLEETLDPYQFEPESSDNENCSNQDDFLESDQEVVEENGENVHWRLNSKDWCKCGNCQQQLNLMECVCCTELQNTKNILEKIT